MRLFICPLLCTETTMNAYRQDGKLLADLKIRVVELRFRLGLMIKKRLAEVFFHAMCAVIQQVHHSPVIWQCGTGATSLIRHRCRSMQQHQDSFGSIPTLLTRTKKSSLSLISCKYFNFVLQRRQNTREANLLEFMFDRYSVTSE